MKKWFDHIVAFIRYCAGLQIPIYAACAGFYMVLAAFPTLVLLVGLIRFTGLDVHSLTEMLTGLIPAPLLPWAQQVILSTYRSTTGTVLSVSAITALWSAGRGVRGLQIGLNGIWEVPEKRGYFLARLVSIGYIFAFLLVLLLTLTLQVFGNSVLDWLSGLQSPVIYLLTRLVDLRFFLLLLLQTLVFTVLYRVLPNRKGSLAQGLPGALLASGGWLIFTDLYAIYVENFAGMSNIYGSIYAVALSMLWLYFCLYLFFCGGALNRWLENMDNL